MTFSTLTRATRRAGLLLAAAALLTTPDAAAQTTYVVQSERDQTLANAAIPNGVVSLREAIEAANTDAAFGDAPAGDGDDIITFDPSVTQVLISRGELSITDGLTIGNETAGAKVVLGVRTNAPTRVFNITTTAPVVMQNVTVRDGLAPVGGGILLDQGGDLSLVNVDIFDNRADDGGGLYVAVGASADLSNVLCVGNRANGGGATNGGGAIYTAGTVTTDPFRSSTFTRNFATVGSGSGGAVFVADGGSFTAVSVDALDASEAGRGLAGTTFFNNRAARAGGAIEVREGGSASLTSAAFFNNRAGNAPGNGGALHITGAGTAALLGSTVEGNFARNEGGGLWNSGLGTLAVVATTVSGNSTVGDGGGVYQQAGAGGTTLISNSTLSGNSASRFGGGLFAEGAAVDVQNSTLSGNTARRGGGGYAAGAAVSFASATIADNAASGVGGGFVNPDAAARVQLQNTLVADNTAQQGPQLSGFFASQGHNLVETRDGAGIAGQQMSDLYDTDAMIGPLGHNGGPTQTHALVDGSPAIDAGMTDFATDQRGEPRAAPHDIGAFDAGSPPAALLLTGMIDGPLPGGTPKAIEVYVLEDVADLSVYGLGSANNGDGTDGEEFTFPAVAATAGDFLYVASEAPQFTAWFGFAPDYTDGAANINGDDAIELFLNGAVVDVFGDIDTDGTGQPWEHLDGWAYRADGSGPDGATFALGSWFFSGPNALDGESSNATASVPFPTGQYSPPPPPPPGLASKQGDLVALAPVAPNPIRSTGRVRFTVAESQAVTVELYDVMGRRVQSLYAGTPAAEATVDVTVDASALASGVYVVVLQSATLRETQRVTVVR